MAILDQGSTNVSPAPKVSEIGPALEAGQKLILRNVGPVPVWLGTEAQAAPHAGIPLVAGESFVTDDPSGGGVWAVTENNPSIPGICSWAVTDAYSPALSMAWPLDAFLGTFPIPAAAGTYPLFTDLPVAGWDSLGLEILPNTLGNNVSLVASWDHFNPAKGAGGLVLGAGAGGVTQRSHHLQDLRGVALRDIWGHEGDYLSVSLVVGTTGMGGGVGGFVNLWNTRRPRLGGFPASDTAHGAPIGYGDNGRIIYLTNLALGPGNTSFALPPFAGRVHVWAYNTGVAASLFWGIFGGRIEEGAPGEAIHQFPNGQNLTADLDLPPLINWVVGFNGTGVAQASNYLTMTVSSARSNP